MSTRLLVLSNGHGEDLIALRLIESLMRRRPLLEVSVLPLVGEGSVYEEAERRGLLMRLGPRRPLPSGGFSNQSLRALLQDLGAGLALQSWRQWRIVRRWGLRGEPVLAVGDLLPLLMAWAGRGPYAFVGTPKSDFTWASPTPRGWGRLPLADAYHRCKGSEWDPWEWALMKQRRCRLVAVRDRLTARGLRRHGVKAIAPGNPMMDGFLREPTPPWLEGRRRLLLLPGSRMPEAMGNLRRLLTALPSATAHPSGANPVPSSLPITVLLPTGSRPGPDDLGPLLRREGFLSMPPPDGSGAVAAWIRGPLQLLIGPDCFYAWAPMAELGLATAGTATEQLTGLGVPALSLPGPGPQFKVGFACRQSRLLGGAAQPCHSGAELKERLEHLLLDGAESRRLGAIGKRRMGPAGGSDRLAALIASRLLG